MTGPDGEVRLVGYFKGQDTTPFLLARVAELTGGDSLTSNIRLVYNNVALAARIAKAL